MDLPERAPPVTRVRWALSYPDLEHSSIRNRSRPGHAKCFREFVFDRVVVSEVYGDHVGSIGDRVAVA